MEHLALYSNTTLEGFCERLATLLNLPDFEFDNENETEWGESKKGDVKFDVSRPYKKGTLKEWDDTVPENCNFGITITKPLINTSEILKIGQLIADEFREAVFYHRTWIEPGKSIKREIKIKTSHSKI